MSVPIHRGYRDPRLVGKASSDLTPFLARKGEEVISEGHPQTPGNPDLSGLHTPYFINLPGRRKRTWERQTSTQVAT